MSLEIEHNFFDFDLDSVRKILESLGTSHKIYFFKVYRYVDEERGLRIRLRDEDHRKTFTIKKRMKKNDKYETEYEINISDIEMAKKMLELLGIKFEKKHYYEKIREAYYYKKSEIAIDYYPGTHNMLQIESPTEKEMLSIAKQLKLSMKDKPKDILAFYGIDIEKINKVMPPTFAKMAKIQKLVTKNKREYNKLVKTQTDALKEVKSKK